MNILYIGHNDGVGKKTVASLMKARFTNCGLNVDITHDDLSYLLKMATKDYKVDILIVTKFTLPINDQLEGITINVKHPDYDTSNHPNDKLEYDYVINNNSSLGQLEVEVYNLTTELLRNNFGKRKK